MRDGPAQSRDRAAGQVPTSRRGGTFQFSGAACGVCPQEGIIKS